MYFPVVKNIFLIMALAAIGLIVSACGGENAFTAGCDAADTPTVIDTFAVSGVGTAGGLEVINDSGDFTLSWDLTSSCTYGYSVFLSYDDNLEPPGEPTTDVAFIGGTCGFGYDCGKSVDFTCSFDATAKSISCNGGSAVEVGSAMGITSPQTPYIILAATNEMGDGPVVAVQQVQIEF